MKKNYLLLILLVAVIPLIFLAIKQMTPEEQNAHKAQGPCPSCGQIVSGQLMDWIGDQGGNQFYSASCENCGIKLTAGEKTDKTNAAWIQPNTPIPASP